MTEKPREIGSRPTMAYLWIAVAQPGTYKALTSHFSWNPRAFRNRAQTLSGFPPAGQGATTRPK
ncbi:hypothetical protein GCM10022420_092610 [Streptomyces iranensis]